MDLHRLYPLLKILADGRFHSGETLGRELGISRTAVWKRLRMIERVGLEVQAVSGKGYRLRQPLELLQRDHVLSALDPASRALLARLEILPQLDSTNRYLMDRAEHGIACFAEFQSAGRGRRGRKWHSPFAANLYLSVSWHFDTPAAALSGLSLAAGVWIADALQAAGVEGTQLKWPNDVLHGGNKLAGILTELKGEAEGPCLAVVGIGLNLEMPLQEAGGIDQPWTDLCTVTGTRPPRNRIAGLLLRHVLQGLAEYQRTGLAATRQRWHRLDYTAGKPVRLLLPSGTVSGTAQGIDEQGALLLRSGENVHAIHSGQVSLRRNS